MASKLKLPLTLTQSERYKNQQSDNYIIEIKADLESEDYELLLPRKNDSGYLSNPGNGVLSWSPISSIIGPVEIKVNTTTKDPMFKLTQSGTGDSSLKFSASGTDYTMGIEPGAPDAFKISRGSQLGTNDLFVHDGANTTLYSNLTVVGTTTSVATTNLIVSDVNVKVAKDNITNLVDFGVYGTWNDGTQRYGGFYRDYTSGRYKFYNTTTEPATIVSGATLANLSVSDLACTTINSITAPNQALLTTSDVTFNSITDGTTILVGGAITGTTLSTTSTIKGMNNQLQVGTADAFNRNQIWYYASNDPDPDNSSASYAGDGPVLRYGGTNADGDPVNVISEGAVFYGIPSTGGALTSGNFAFARIKPLRFQLIERPTPGPAIDIFKVNENNLKWRQTGGTVDVINASSTGLNVNGDVTITGTGNLAANGTLKTNNANFISSTGGNYFAFPTSIPGTIGSSNLIVSDTTAINNVGASNNTIIGISDFAGFTSGTQVVVVGNSITQASASETNSVNIGYNFTSRGNNTVTIGNTSVQDAKFGYSKHDFSALTVERTVTYPDANVDLSSTYGELYISKKNVDYSTWNFSSADWVTIQASSTKGTWYQITGFTVGDGNGVTLSTSSITINTTAVYKVCCEFTGNITGASANAIEIGIGINSSPPAATASPNVVALMEESTTDTHPKSGSVSVVLSLSATDIISMWIRHVAGSPTGENILCARAMLSLIKL
jgi:hypothetical protein